ncbi:hypothetical protein F2Q68_00043172 [Brassica cretica]|uniref:Uncharacterized protein n=1 Tax=Brassica cretica TaxID=69181 RepID=A0A8S9LPU5_BRACR|nr:hypothetical protein F2Q68_00043172 [Brassica cretica]
MPSLFRIGDSASLFFRSLSNESTMISLLTELNGIDDDLSSTESVEDLSLMESVGVSLDGRIKRRRFVKQDNYNCNKDGSIKSLLICSVFVSLHGWIKRHEQG